MMALLRSVGALAAGVAVTIVLVIAAEILSMVLHPFPEGFQGTPEEVCQHVERFPPWALAVGAALWGVSAFAGTWTAGRLGNRWCALILALLVLSAVIMNISMLPYPPWFKIGVLVVIPMASVCGYRLSRRRVGAAPAPERAG